MHAVTASTSGQARERELLRHFAVRRGQLPVEIVVQVVHHTFPLEFRFLRLINGATRSDHCVSTAASAARQIASGAVSARRWRERVCRPPSHQRSTAADAPSRSRCSMSSQPMFTSAMSRQWLGGVASSARPASREGHLYLRLIFHGRSRMTLTVRLLLPVLGRHPLTPRADPETRGEGTRGIAIGSVAEQPADEALHADCLSVRVSSSASIAASSRQRALHDGAERFRLLRCGCDPPGFGGRCDELAAACPGIRAYSVSALAKSRCAMLRVVSSSLESRSVPAEA
jgi:hypothetical protein